MARPFLPRYLSPHRFQGKKCAHPRGRRNRTGCEEATCFSRSSVADDWNRDESFVLLLRTVQIVFSAWIPKVQICATTVLDLENYGSMEKRCARTNRLRYSPPNAGAALGQTLESAKKKKCHCSKKGACLHQPRAHNLQEGQTRHSGWHLIRFVFNFSGL